MTDVELLATELENAEDVIDKLSAKLAERDAVLTQALESLAESCGDRCNAEYNPCHARLAADAIRKVLG